MKITNLKITGFRSLRDVDWHPGDLNIVIGPNASGKSNLLDIVQLLTSLSKRGLADYVQSRGGITALLWDGKAERIGISIDLSFPEFDPNNRPLRYVFALKQTSPFISYEIVEEKIVDLDTGSEFVLQRPSVPAGSLGWYLTNAPSQEMEKRDECVLPIMPTHQGPDASRYAVWQMVGWTCHQVVDTSPAAEVRRPPVARYQMQVAGDGSNLISVLHTLYTENRRFTESVDLAMKAAFNDYQGLIFPPAGDQHVQLRVRWKSLDRPCSSADLSDGTLRFLYLIAILANPHLPSLIAIDEPETGLHPRMMSIVAEYAVDAAMRTQVIFTTHSAEFLDAFRDVQPTVTVAELVDGATQLRTISGDDLAHWLEEFTLGEIYRSRKLESMG